MAPADHEGCSRTSGRADRRRGVAASGGERIETRRRPPRAARRRALRGQRRKPSPTRQRYRIQRHRPAWSIAGSAWRAPRILGPTARMRTRPRDTAHRAHRSTRRRTREREPWRLEAFPQRAQRGENPSVPGVKITHCATSPMAPGLLPFGESALAASKWLFHALHWRTGQPGRTPLVAKRRRPGARGFAVLRLRYSTPSRISISQDDLLDTPGIAQRHAKPPTRARVAWQTGRPEGKRTKRMRKAPADQTTQSPASRRTRSAARR